MSSLLDNEPNDKKKSAQAQEPEVKTSEEQTSKNLYYSCTVLKVQCDETDLKNPKLPNDTYIVEYSVNNKNFKDLVRAGKKSEIFDMYYDKYRENLMTIDHAYGTISPRLWDIKPIVETKKRK
jgi:hypothetical protein